MIEEHMRQALELALEALETLMIERESIYDKAITAIKEALAQPEQTNTRPYYTIDELNAWADEKEKQAWRNAAIRIGEELSSVGPDGYYDMDAWKWLDWAMEQEPRGKNSLAQPEQEPVAWRTKNFYENQEGWFYADWHQDGLTPQVAELLYTTPPQRTWVGLTDEDRYEFAAAQYGWEDLLIAAEAKLKEKNTNKSKEKNT